MVGAMTTRHYCVGNDHLWEDRSVVHVGESKVCTLCGLALSRPWTSKAMRQVTLLRAREANNGPWGLALLGVTAD